MCARIELDRRIHAADVPDAVYAVLCCAAPDCDKGSLSSYLAQWPAPYEGTEPGSMLRVLQLLQDTAQGLDELHREHVVHGDLVSGQEPLCVLRVCAGGEGGTQQL